MTPEEAVDFWRGLAIFFFAYSLTVVVMAIAATWPRR